MATLPSPSYLAFPFRIESAGAATAERAQHVRQQIEQVLFTNPGERVFRAEFGAGVQALVFEPNDSALAAVTRKRLMAALTEVLQGEVDPRSLQVEVTGEGEMLSVVVSYRLATLGYSEEHRFAMGAGGGRLG